MIFRNSVKQVVRTPARTGLFVLLLAAITAFLSIGIGLNLSASRSIALADSAFTTIGVISHRDRQTPEFNQYDIVNHDYSSITDSRHVKSLDHRVMLAGVVGDMHTVYDDFMKSYIRRLGMHYSVLEFTPLESVAAGEPVQIQVLKVLHSYGGPHSGGYGSMRIAFKAGGRTTILQENYSGADREFYELHAGKTYVATGFSLSGDFSVGLDIAERQLHHWGVLQEGDFFPAIMEIETEDYLQQGDGLGWAHLVEIYQNSVRTLNVCTTNDLACSSFIRIMPRSSKADSSPRQIMTRVPRS